MGASGCSCDLEDVQAAFHQDLVVVWMETGTERSQKKTPRFLELTRSHLVVPFSKVGKTKEGTGPGEKDQDGKLLR